MFRNSGYKDINNYNEVIKYRKLDDNDILLLVSNLPSLLRTNKYIKKRYDTIMKY